MYIQLYSLNPKESFSRCKFNFYRACDFCRRKLDIEIVIRRDVTKFPSATCPLSLTSFPWFTDYLKKKVKIVCNVYFSLIISNRITIFGMCVPCKVFMPVRQISLDLDLTSCTSEQGKVLMVKSISQIL